VKQLARLTLAVVLAASAVPASAGDVRVSFSNGRVTIVATDASPRQILTEWARQGQVRIANLDRLSGGPVTLQLVDVPEAQALETILRGAAGYVAAPRAESVVAASGYDRIMLMPGVAPTLPAAGSSPAPAMNMGANRGRPSNIPTFDIASDEDPEAARPGMVPGVARDAARYDASRQPGQGQAVTPGIMTPGLYSPYAAGTSGSPAAVRQPVSAPVSDPTGGGVRQPVSSAGAATPGVFTAAPPATSSPVPGQVVGQPAQTAGAPAAGASPATTFQNPYGIAEPVRPPVVLPNANPYGLPTPVKVAPAPTTPPGPIKQSGTDGGQG
jgi:hypothetical protein